MGWRSNRKFERIEAAFTSPTRFAVRPPWDNCCKLLLHFCGRNCHDGGKRGKGRAAEVFKRKRAARTRAILLGIELGPRVWNFLIYSCNLCFWSLLTLRGRCHWRATSRCGGCLFCCLVIYHSAWCIEQNVSRASILQCSELKGRKKKSRLSLGSISDYFNIEQENTLVPIYTTFYYGTLYVAYPWIVIYTAIICSYFALLVYSVGN